MLNSRDSTWSIWTWLRSSGRAETAHQGAATYAHTDYTLFRLAMCSEWTILRIHESTSSTPKARTLNSILSNLDRPCENDCGP
jgi:hypothetical protein